MNVVHVGWCREGTHDKVWGVIRLSENSQILGYWDSAKYVIFWGRRGKTLQTKIEITSQYKVEKEFEKKLDKGYQEIKISDLHTVYPDFKSDLEKTAVWVMLKD